MEDTADGASRPGEGVPSPSTGSDDDLIAGLLGRRPQGDYSVVVRRGDGSPVVLANAPFLHSGRPMPTRYWLIDPAINKAIGTLESTGGVKRAEATVEPDLLQAAHDRYRAEREQLIPSTHAGPRPSGGVGGTRVGVKCLHAHYAYFLAGGDDPVGRWVHDRLSETGDALTAMSAVSTTPAPTPPSGADVDKAAPATEFAVVEIGSGAVKALIEAADGSQTRLRHQTRILADRADGGALSARGRQRLVDALTAVRDDIDQHRSGSRRTITVVATEAMRVADAGEVDSLVSDLFGCRLETLTAQREAELGYRGAVAGVDVESPPVITLDIGYGSTELATRLPDGMVSMSLPIGAETITANYLAGDPPKAEELSAALSVIELHLDDVNREHPQLAEAIGFGEIRGLGAIRFIAEVELGQAEGDAIHGYWLERRDLEEVFRTLATEARIDRAANPGLRPEHVDVVVGAICILVEFMRQFAVDGLEVSTAGVIDGVATLVRAGRFP